QDESSVDATAQGEAASMESTPDNSADIAAGEALFKANCAACHKMDGKAVGPALRGSGQKFEREWLYKWIHASQALIKSGDATAVKLFEENNKMIMTPFPALSETDIDNILAYTDQPKSAPAAATATTETQTSSGGGEGGVSNGLVLGALLVVFLLLVI